MTPPNPILAQIKKRETWGYGNEEFLSDGYRASILQYEKCSVVGWW